MQWQPIETAPKDGSMILAFNTAHGDMAVVGWTPAEPNIMWAGWTDVGSQNRAGATYHNENYFQFWMPLPEPPASPKQPGAK